MPTPPVAVPPPAPRPPAAATDDLAQLDGVATARAIARGDVGAVEVVEAAVRRAEALDPVLGGLVTPTPEQALAAAAVVRPGPGAPLAGVPTAVKDLADVAGVRTASGTRATGHHVARRTAPSVAQLLGTGMVSIGKSATSEYGLTPTVEPLGFRPACNPWDLQRSTGGSSGGAAALVAAGIVPIAHATDGGGSIRIPAAACGLVGLKPSEGRMVPVDGADRLPVRIVASGVVTRTVRDTAAFLAAAEQVRPSPSLPPVGHVTEPGGQRLRIAVVTTSPVAAVAPDVVAATRRTAEALADLGHDVEEIASPIGPGLAEDFLRYWALVAALVPRLGRRQVGAAFDPDLLDPWTRGLAAGARAEAWRLPGTVRRLRRVRRTYDDLMARHHVLVAPTTATTAPALGWLDVTLPVEVHRDRAMAFTPFTPLWNLSGAPAISLPVGRDRHGLPIGVQLGARVGEEGRLLSLALALEARGGFLDPVG